MGSVGGPARRAVVVALALASGCEGQITSESNSGFVRPTETAAANQRNADGIYEPVGPADYSCLDDNAAAETTVEVALTGFVLDFQSRAPLGDVEVSLYAGSELDDALDTTTSAEDGAFALTVPAGTTRASFLTQIDRAMDTYVVQQPFQPDAAEQMIDLPSVSTNTAQALPALIGILRTEGTGIVAGSVRDCQGDLVSNVVAALSSRRGAAAHVGGATTFYFSGTFTSLPVEHEDRLSTNVDGLFALIEVPPEDAFIQVWGFLDGQDPAADALTLLAEIPAPVRADAVVTVAAQPGVIQ